MRWKVVLPILAIVILAGLGLYLFLGHTLYSSHAAVVDETVAGILARHDGALPMQQTDLSAGDKAIVRTKVAAWRAERIELDNNAALVRSLVDDDPIYRLKADLHVTYEDGRQAVVAWESWRYGLVVGPVVFSGGDGPPGQIVSVTFAE